MNGYKTIQVADRQCVTDIAIQQYGCYEGVFELLKDNPTKLNGLHDVPAPGTSLLIKTPVPKLTATNQTIAAKFADKKMVVVSGSEYVPVETGYVVTAYWDEFYTTTIKTG